MRSNCRLSALVVGLGFALVANVFGQASAINGEITGTVTDPSGAAISNAVVQIGNTDTGFKLSTKTGESGLYRFTVLPLGTYDIAVQAPGFATTRRTGIALSAGATATMDITVDVEGTTTTVEVTASAAITEPSRTDLGSTLSENMTRNLPLVSRNPYNFILFQPNVSGRANTEFGVPRKINANGFNGRINYQLDGSNNTESDRAGIRLIPVSDIYVAEVQQVSNGFAPEFGNTVGTVFNTVTKSGANDFHGEGAYLFRRTDFSARPKLLSSTALVPAVNVDSYSVDGGGRVIKDKVFFFGAFEHVKRDLPGVVTVSAANIAALGLPASYGNPIPFRQSVYFYMGKGDWQINAKNRLSVRYMHHANDSPYNNGTIGGLNLVSQSYNFVDRSHVGGVQLVSVINDHIVNELRGQVAYRGQLQNSFSASGTGPVITVAGIANFGGPNGAGFVYQETTPELADNFSYIRGAHSFKFGASTHAIRDTQVQPTYAQYNFPTIAAYLAAMNGSAPKGYSSFSQIVGNPSLNYNSLFTNFFAQDSWKPVRNLTVTYGLRYDLYQMPPADRTSPFAYSQSFRTDKNNFGAATGCGVGIGQGRQDGDPRELGHLLRFATDGPVSAGHLLQRESGVLHHVGDTGAELRAVVPKRLYGPTGGRYREHRHHHHLAGFRQPVFDECELLGEPRIDADDCADGVLSLHGRQAAAGVSQHQRGAERKIPGGRAPDLRHGALLRGLRQHHVGGIGGQLHL